MSRLIRLYPAGWRARYGDELVELLRERPLTLSGQVDLARGAMDAHLNPQLSGQGPQPWTHRIPGLLALSAGLLWTWSFAFLAFWADPYADWGSGFGIAFLIMLISLPGDYLAAYGRRIAAGIGIVIGGFVLGRLLPWSVADGLLNILSGGAAYLVIVAGILTLVAIRANLGARVRWLLIGTTVVVPVLVAVPVITGLADLRAPFTPIYAFLVPYGLAWAAAGLRMIVRGAPTLVDVVPDVST